MIWKINLNCYEDKIDQLKKKEKEINHFFHDSAGIKLQREKSAIIHLSFFLQDRAVVCIW